MKPDSDICWLGLARGSRHVLRPSKEGGLDSAPEQLSTPSSDLRNLDVAIPVSSSSEWVNITGSTSSEAFETEISFGDDPIEFTCNPCSVGASYQEYTDTALVRDLSVYNVTTNFSPLTYFI
jgi:hypothetical protein